MPIIAISRGSFSGGSRLAEELHSRLGWRVLSQEVITEAARKYGVSEEEMLRALDHPANFFERMTRRKQRYILASQAVLVEAFADGDGIYHGLGGAFLFEDLCNIYRVLLVAPMEWRVAALMEDRLVTHDQAVSYIRNEDERRAKWGRQMFGVEWNEPSLYDIVIDLERLDIEAAADAIAKIVSSEKYHPTPKCVQEFTSFTLATRVKAELYFNSSFNHDIVEVTATGSTVRLAGGRAFEATRTALVDWVRAIPGVEKVVTNLDDKEVPGTAVDLDFGMSTRDTRARDVMLPPNSYPHLNQDVSIRDAIVALSASAVRLDDGYFLAPRYILILDDNERLVGIVSRRELLEGLVPQIRESKTSRRHIQELVPFAGDMPSEIFINWTSLFTHRAVASSYEPVGTVMRRVRASVGMEDSLSTVITTMLHHGVDLLPVLDGDRVAGVVVMTNIFDLVGQFIMEHGVKDG